jgi:hypothetical protein
LIATGGKDKKLYVWDITDLKKPKYEFEAGATINSVIIFVLLIKRSLSTHFSPSLLPLLKMKSEFGV